MGIAQSTLRQLWVKEKLEAAPQLNPKLPKPSSPAGPLDPRKLLEHPEESGLLNELVPIGDAPLLDFDPGVLGEELLNLKIFQAVDSAATPGRHSSRYAGGNIVEGTYSGTQAALTQIYSRLERSYESYYDCLGIEPTLPRFIDLEEKREIYQWSSYPLGEDGKPAAFPPFLQHIPKEDDVAKWKIFNALGLAQASVILQKVTPDDFLGKTADWLLEKARCAVGGSPQVGVTIKDVEDYNRWHRKSGTDIARGENLGMLDDWFSDRRFADQAFTGTNPKTIERASAGLIKEFAEAARAGGYSEWAARLPRIDPASLLVQDCSYFREAMGAAADEVIHHKQPAGDENWACAAVTLFQLHDDGKLHPIAITIDYKGTMADSVTIFNKRMSPSDSTRGEATDWPWRYAKTCAQVSDWYRHEVTVHLTETHFVEEVIIVATNRAVPMDHILFKLLQPHWYKTLSLNAAGRTGLVPDVIFDVVGTSPEQGSRFIRHAFESFDFVGEYVPNQLRARGFPADAAGLADARYRNYPYARNMLAMWTVLREYAGAMLATHYGTGPAADARVAEDAAVAAWVREVRGQGHMPSFPAIGTVAELADAVTMCVHLAAPMHTAVNYLQNFYQAFVPAKPASLCAPPPATLAALRAYGEADLVAALPLNRQRQWLLQSMVPWLLSFRVAADRSLRNFALSQWSVYRRKTAPRDLAVRDASARLYQELGRLARLFYSHSRAMDAGSIPYMVMDPGATAVSILI